MRLGDIYIEQFAGDCSALYLESTDLSAFQRVNDIEKLLRSTHVMRAVDKDATVGLCHFSLSSKAAQVTLSDVEVLEGYRQRGIAKSFVGGVFEFASMIHKESGSAQILLTGFTAVGEQAIIPSIHQWMNEYPEINVYSL